MSKEVFMSREIGRNGSQSVLEVDHSMRTYRTGGSMNTTLRTGRAKEIPSYKLDFMVSNLKAKRYQNLGRR